MSEQPQILYMDDNEGTARLLQKRLSRAGYRIDTAPNGEEGLAQCAAQPYDAIIVDYNMPGMNGIQVIQHLAERGMLPPTIMLTGTGTERIAVDALKLGASDYVIKDIDGVYLELLPTVIDQALKSQQIREDKLKADESLRESEERFRVLFEQAPDPYFVNDLTGNLLDCNRAVEPLLGMSRSELIGKNFAEMGLFTSDQLMKIAEILADVPEGGTSRPPELTVTRWDGKEVVVDLRMIPIQRKGQTQILGIGHDITWRKQAEAQMKTHMDQLKVLHRVDDVLTRILDVHYAQTMSLDNMLRLSGANAGSIALSDENGIKNVQSIGYPEELNQHYSLDNRSIVARVARQREAEWVQDVTSDPDYFPVLDDTCSQITIPLVSQDHLIGIVSLETNRAERFHAGIFEFLKLVAARIAVAIDNARLYDTSQQQLAELRDLYEQVRKLEQLKTDMIRIVSHDLRNPLSLITSSMYLLERSLESAITENQQRYISQIGQSIDRMKSLTTDVLSVENIERLGRGEISLKKIDLQEIIEELVESARTEAEQKKQTLSFSTVDLPMKVSGSKVEFQQAASNLISNAIKYTPEGGRIDVSLKCIDQRVHFEVRDTGYGIPQADQLTLFQPFERVKTEETRSIEGTGLGLYIVKKIVERNHGEIMFSSEYGKGSTFGFVLPLALE